MHDALGPLLESLGGNDARAYVLAERLEGDDDLEGKFLALEALSEMERPRTIRAMKEVLRIFKD